MGVLHFTAAYLPWVMLVLHGLMGGRVAVDILSIGVGHLYWYLEDVVPRMLPGCPRPYLAPDIVRMLMGEYPRGVPRMLPARIAPGAHMARRRGDWGAGDGSEGEERGDEGGRGRAASGEERDGVGGGSTGTLRRRTDAPPRSLDAH